jgi:hypothetical protein
LLRAEVGENGEWRWSLRRERDGEISPVFTDRSHTAELLGIMLDRSTMRGVAEAEAQRPGSYEEDEECYPCWFFSGDGR